MADVTIGSDALLVTTLNDNDRVTITRQATSQQVATMKVAEFRKTMILDYSSLTEKIVPGEFWYDKNGNKKQVYIRAIIANTAGGHVIFYGATGLVSVNGYVINGTSGNIDCILANYFSFIDIYISPQGTWANEFRMVKKGDKDLDFCIVVKYTK